MMGSQNNLRCARATLLACTTMAGFGAVLTAEDAQAATVNSVSFQGAEDNPQGTACIVRTQINLDANSNDSGVDWVQISGQTVSGTRFNTPITRSPTFGQTVTLNEAVGISHHRPDATIT